MAVNRAYSQQHRHGERDEEKDGTRSAGFGGFFVLILCVAVAMLAYHAFSDGPESNDTPVSSVEHPTDLRGN